MITRDIIRQLADMQSSQGDAITFFYQPDAPPDKSHRQEAILVKDMVKEAMHRAEHAGKNGTLKSDLQRILELAEQLHGNQGRAKLVFACGSQDLWREFDVPVRSGARTDLQINNRFHLKPLALLSEALQKTCVCLIDRTNARFFEMQGEDITELEGFTDELSYRGRSYGFEGFDAGHVERKLENDAAQHFKRVADRLMERYGNGQCDNIAIGCRDEIWTHVERQLHPYVKQRLVGHFVIDPLVASTDEVRHRVEGVLAEKRAKQRQEMLLEVLDEARANNNGALGLRRVLRSMEQGEVQKLLLGEGFSAEGVECGNCGHIDMRMVSNCAVCGQKTHEIEDISDALIGRALRMNIDVVHIPGDPEFQKAGNIGALLRFRAERSVGERLA
jgi:peptide subunit release factor 1 (eRF1)